MTESNLLSKKPGIGMFVTSEAVNIIKEKRLKDFRESKVASIVEEAKILNITVEKLYELIKEKYDD